ncbi:MAG: hypothetical protein AB7S70_08100 [Hyphomicrobium sp.]|uniref:hypothetical protein n=1 Tax=Hyphomicrobium sp. TaxID=82 RepID=UPI003D12858F
MPHPAFIAALVIASALFAAPISPAFAGREDRAAEVNDDDGDARAALKERQRAKQAYRKKQAQWRAEKARRARLAKQRTYRYSYPWTAAWGPFPGPPGL